METLKQQIEEIYNYHPKDYRNIEDRNRDAIKLIAARLDELSYEIGVIHEWKLEKEGI